MTLQNPVGGIESNVVVMNGISVLGCQIDSCCFNVKRVSKSVEDCVVKSVEFVDAVV